MKRFLVYIFLTLLLVISIDLVGRVSLYYLIKNIPNNTSHLSKVYKSLSIDSVGFIVVGMSTAEHNYNIKIFEDSLLMLGYDCGSDGRNIYYDYMVVSNAIKNAMELKLVIVDISRATLTNETKDRINIVYPFYWANPTVREVTKDLKGKKMDVFMLSSLYQMNSGLQNIWRLFHPLSFKEYHGFSPYPYTENAINIRNSKIINNSLDVDEKVVEYLNKIVKDCKNNNISVLLVTSPCLTRDRETSIWLSEYALKHNVEYYDYSSCEEIISNSSFFRDEYHLNEKGAEIYSKIVAMRVKSQMSNLW